jgi:type VI secretion system protein ImpC
MKGHLRHDFTFAAPGAKGQQPIEGKPFRILLIGDFSGRAWRRTKGDVAPLRPPMAVDVESFDRILAALGPQAPIASGSDEEPTAIMMKELDAFHPDALFSGLSTFEALRGIKAKLKAGGSVDEAADEIKRRLGMPAAPASDKAVSNERPAQEHSEPTGALFERLLGRAPAERPSTEVAPPLVQALLESAARPHIVPNVDVARTTLVKLIDGAITARMREVLGHRDFRALEASWRGARWVAGTLETGGELQVYLFDAAKEDLAEDIRNAPGQLESSLLHRLLVEHEDEWAAWAVDHTFGAEQGDVALLAAMGALAARTGGVLLGGASPDLFGCSSPSEVSTPERWQPAVIGSGADFWRELRASPLARHIGLVFPRILLRLPYGKKTDPIDSFAFQEVDEADDADTETRVWGGAALGAAILLGLAFQGSGWDMDRHQELDLDDLPSHTFEDAGETRLYPCAEWALSERTATRILDRGIMPVMSRRDRNAVRFLRLQSIADPPAPLAGPWEEHS